MGLRERKRQDTRHRLLEAARRLFEEHGYDDTTVDMIAQQADVSPRTFHRYFATKDAVVAEGSNRIVAHAIQLLPGSATIPDIVRCLVAAVEEDIDGDTFAWTVRLRRENPTLRSISPRWLDDWQQDLAVALAASDGHDEPTLSHRVRSATAVRTSVLAADEWILRRPDRRLSDIAEEVIGTLVADLASSVGQPVP